MTDLRSENWTLTLYTDNEADKRTLEYITKNFNYAYILHNKDINKETGEIKKEHIHVVIKLENARTIKSIAEELYIEENRVEKVRNYRKMIRYLLHLDNKEKYQYNKEEIQSNVWETIEKYFKDNTESGDIKEIFEYIYSIDRYLYFHEVLEFVLYNNLYASYRRGNGIINKIIDEHNKLYLEKKNSEKFEKLMQEKEIYEYDNCKRNDTRKNGKRI